MYSEGFILGVKRKLKNARAYTREGGTLFLDFMVYYDFTISEGGALFLGFNGIL